MSANVQFHLMSVSNRNSSKGESRNINSKVVTTASSNTKTSSQARLVLPYDVLVNLQERRVTVCLSVGNEELEGLLRTVDSDRGDLFLENVSHYRWSCKSEITEETSQTQLAHRTPTNMTTFDNKLAAELGVKDEEIKNKESVIVKNLIQEQVCVGGGIRVQLQRYAAMMVNSKYIEFITPTVFTKN